MGGDMALLHICWICCALGGNTAFRVFCVLLQAYIVRLHPLPVRINSAYLVCSASAPCTLEYSLAYLCPMASHTNYPLPRFDAAYAL
jgi:hypothetical protein